MTTIPRTMATQHPDNVRSAFFAANSVLADDDEIKEAFYSYSHLKIREQLWDFEGKDVDSGVVRKLLPRYEPFFREHKLGQDVFLTYRVPNPDVEKNEGKILLETLESIPRSFDVAKAFYGSEIAPIFEVAVPMVTNSASLIRVSEYYKRFVAGKENATLFSGDGPLSNWVGGFNPKSLRIIPLMEDKESILGADTIVSEFVKHQKVSDYQRVWLARSDPALNYGSVPTVLIEKIALQRLHQLSKKLSVDIHPILGCGSCPFRGNFKPTNVDKNLKAYPSVQTFTLQSAYRYDYDEKVVRESVDTIEAAAVKEPMPVDEESVLPVIEKLATAYREQITQIAPLVNDFSAHIPKRRKRKLHIGLFGYSRSGGGVQLPRAIGFCASLYSLGIPPELLGLHALTPKDMETIDHAYKNMLTDLRDAAQYLNTENLKILPTKVQEQIKTAAKMVGAEVNREHQKVTSIILDDFKKKNPVLSENIERAGWIRGFLG